MLAAQVKRRPAGLGPVVGVALAALAVAGLFAGTWFSQDWPVTRNDSVLIASIYDPPTRSIEAAFNQGDGQIFALQASDPLIRRTDLFGSRVPGHHAYRWERPLYGYLGWALSFGNPGRVPEALVALTVLSVAALAGAVALAIRRFGGDVRFALLVVMSPGVLANLRDIGPESLATAVALFGLLAWDRRDGSRWLAVACLAAAALCRETMLLVPAALALHAQFGKGSGRWFSWKPDAWRAAAAALPLVAWVVLLRLRIGVWPKPSNETLINPIPFAGFIGGLAQWSTAEWLGAVAVIIPTVWLLATTRAKGSAFAPVLYAYAAFSVFVGATMWGDDMKFGRLLLPLTALAVVQLARVLAGDQASRESERNTGAPTASDTVAAPEPVAHPAT